MNIFKLTERKYCCLGKKKHDKRGDTEVDLREPEKTKDYN